MNRRGPSSNDQPDAPKGAYGEKAAAGGRWAALDTLFVQASTTVSTLVLARILSPADFGAVAAAMVIVGLFDLFTQIGLGSSLVRRDRLSNEETSTVFWIAVVVGVTVAGAAFVFAGPLTSLIGQPDAAALVRVLAWTIPLGQVRNIGLALLVRQLRFKGVSLVGVASAILYLVVAISLALAGFGPWAIVIGYLARASISSVLMLVTAEWVPMLVFERGFVAGELRFSGGIAGQRAVDYLYKNVDYWVISARLGADALGVYYIAFVIPNLVRQRLTAIAGQVFYPVMARIHEETDRARSAYVRIIRTIAFVAIPALVGISVLSDLVVSIAFGGAWAEAVAPLATLALAAAVTSVTSLCGALASAVGRPHIVIPAQLASLAALVLGLVVTVPSGDLALISWSVVVAAVVAFVGLYLTTGPLIGLTIGHLLWRLMPVIVPTALMYVVLWLIREVVTDRFGDITSAVLLVSVGAAVYLGFSWLLFRRDFGDQLNSVRQILVPGKSKTGAGPEDE
jgi:PST family polysaccharide transporter